MNPWIVLGWMVAVGGLLSCTQAQESIRLRDVSVVTCRRGEWTRRLRTTATPCLVCVQNGHGLSTWCGDPANQPTSILCTNVGLDANSGGSEGGRSSPSWRCEAHGLPAGLE